MTLYEIDQAIQGLVDPETGELMDYEAFAALQMDRDAKIENMALWYKDLMADAKAMLDLIIEAKRNDPETGSFAEWLAEHLAEHMPTLTPQNEPLTLEQLREMDGQPVWDSSLRCWGIVKSEKDSDVFLQTKSGEFGLDPLGRVKIYRRPPEGEA